MKIVRSKKALSPVVASIILIAVTVAVSIAVAAWMGALSFGFMGTEQLSITKVEFTDEGKTITLTVRNTGTSDVLIETATVNGQDATVEDAPVKVPKNDKETIVLTLEENWKEGSSYQIRLLSTKGNYFPYNAVAPQ